MRKYRQLSETTREKISQAMKGKEKTATHRAAIARAMLQYWSHIPYQPTGTPESDNESKKPLTDEADM